MNIILIDNFDSFTFNLDFEFKCLGLNVIVVRNNIEIKEFDTLVQKDSIIVLSPGPGRPESAGNMMSIIDKYLGGVPMIGICLGMQALCLALGGSVKSASKIVHGKCKVITHNNEGIFKDMPSYIFVGRYHSLACDNLPTNVRVLAKSGADMMAFDEPKLKIIGMQFHPESILTEHGSLLLQNAVKQGDISL